jgi:hypothetical protein
MTRLTAKLEKKVGLVNDFADECLWRRSPRSRRRISTQAQPYAIVARNPAKELRRRFDADLIARIEQTRCWMLEPVDLKRLYETLPEAVIQPTRSSLDIIFPAISA